MKASNSISKKRRGSNTQSTASRVRSRYLPRPVPTRRVFGNNNNNRPVLAQRPRNPLSRQSGFRLVRRRSNVGADAVEEKGKPLSWASQQKLREMNEQKRVQSKVRTRIFETFGNPSRRQQAPPAPRSGRIFGRNRPQPAPLPPPRNPLRGAVFKTRDPRMRPIERINRPIERSNRPIERGNRPIERSNRPIERGYLPTERRNRPIERNNRRQAFADNRPLTLDERYQVAQRSVYRERAPIQNRRRFR